MNVLFVTLIQFERWTHYSEKNLLRTVSNKEEIMYLMVKYLKLSKNYYNSVSLTNSIVI